VLIFMKTKSCKQRVSSSWKQVKKDIDKLIKNEDYERLSEYGLSIDKVEAGTFKRQREDYVRYQFSWGGPSDELRFYKNGEIEYWFLDWFDGASLDVSQDKTAQWLFNYCTELVNF
jgi:hypothetical protein